MEMEISTGVGVSQTFVLEGQQCASLYRREQHAEFKTQGGRGKKPLKLQAGTQARSWEAGQPNEAVHREPERFIEFSGEGREGILE